MMFLDRLKDKRDLINKIAKRYHATDVRVFGSVARKDETENSDIDFLVHFLPGATLLDQVGLIDELSQNLDRPVDVVSDRALNKYIADAIIKESILL